MSSELVTEPERHTTVTILVDRELRGRLERAAESNERSMGAEVRVALKQYLQPNEEEAT